MQSKNPHLDQAKKIISVRKSFTLDSRILKDDAPTEKYKSRKNEIKTVIHWGQRKLLMSEIEFLTLYSVPNHIIIYAGAAPGTHIKCLTKLFPKNRFVLVDPSQFKIVETDKITIINDLFTDNLAYKLKNKYQNEILLFISDIRSAIWQSMSTEEVEERVKEDMYAQERWVKIMNPFKSMLKFRLPYSINGIGLEKFEYLDGTVFLPVWGPQTTSETRLIVDKNPKMKIWNPVKYEDQMFYFNTKTRVMYYPHNIKGEGLDHCYDCRSEIFILEQYLTKYSTLNKKEIKNKISQLSKQISRVISPNSKRTLLTKTPIKKTGGTVITNHIVLNQNDFEIVEGKGLLNYKIVPKNKNIKSLIFYRPTCARSLAYLEENKNKRLYLINIDENLALSHDYNVFGLLPQIISLSE